RTGRARVLSASDVSRAKRMRVSGLSYEVIAVMLVVARSTLQRALQKDSEGDKAPKKVTSKGREHGTLTDIKRKQALALLKAGEPILRIAVALDLDRRTIRKLRDT